MTILLYKSEKVFEVWMKVLFRFFWGDAATIRGYSIFGNARSAEHMGLGWPRCGDEQAASGSAPALVNVAIVFVGPPLLCNSGEQ